MVEGGGMWTCWVGLENLICTAEKISGVSRSISREKQWGGNECTRKTLLWLNIQFL